MSAIDAAHVAGFYQGYGYFMDTTESDIQISSKNTGGPVQVGYIISGTNVSPETEEFFKDAATGLQDFFPNRTIAFYLLNTNL